MFPHISANSDSGPSIQKAVWPRDFYVTDIVNYFSACEDVDGQRLSDIFATHFSMASISARLAPWSDSVF
jgi:hypothetical protein